LVMTTAVMASASSVMSCSTSTVLLFRAPRGRPPSPGPNGRPTRLFREFFTGAAGMDAVSVSIVICAQPFKVSPSTMRRIPENSDAFAPSAKAVTPAIRSTRASHFVASLVRFGAANPYLFVRKIPPTEPYQNGSQSVPRGLAGIPTASKRPGDPEAKDIGKRVVEAGAYLHVGEVAEGGVDGI
jgi:hypothetical protein